MQMIKTYRTSEIASRIGVHANTVRFYEEQGILPRVPRARNGYRVYSERHLLQLQLIRLAFRAEILSGNLRREAIDIVKATAGEEYDLAARMILTYRKHLREEVRGARHAIALAERLAGGNLRREEDIAVLGRREAAAHVGVSVDILRDWERNGLLQVPRVGKCRRYGDYEINLLKIIAILRGANYSQMSIRRMLRKLEHGETDLLTAIDTPEKTEDIVSAADQYIFSLSGALQDTREMLRIQNQMKGIG